MENKLKSLRRIEEYEDSDIIAWYVGIDLGIIDEEKYNFSNDCKHIFWSNHPLGERIYRFIQSLAEIGILEENPNDPSQYRWNSRYRGSWEKQLDNKRGKE